MTNKTDLFDFVEKITNQPNAAIFLKEITTYRDRSGQEGGITGITSAKFDAVVKKGGSYQYELADRTHKIHIRSYAGYRDLRTNELAACIYAIAYVELFAHSIPDEKAKRFELFKWIFEQDACRYAYLAL